MRRTLTTIALSMMFALPAFAHRSVTRSVTKSAKPAAVAQDSAKGGAETAPAATDDGAKAEKPAKKKHHKHSKKAKETPAPAEEPAK